MSYSAGLIGPVNPVHFLTIFNYIHTLKTIFYEESLIKETEASSSIHVINVYYQYLNQSHDETKAKERLIQKLLKGSGLYGEKENATLDKEYIDETFTYIVSNVVFAKYGNVYGYLAKMISVSKSVKLSKFKDTLFRGLKKISSINSDKSISRLSELSRSRISDTILLPLFPTPEKDMHITDVNYIYAQAGFMFVHKAHMKTANFTFDEYITISQTLELSAFQNKTEQNALEIFTLPALLFYAHKKRKQLKEQNIKHLIRHKHFWQRVFTVLFSHLKKSFQKIHQKAVKSTPLYQFYYMMSKYKTRTKMGELILRSKCPLLKENEYADEIEHYKSFSSNQYCPNNRSISLPNLEDLYQKQIAIIEKTYCLHVKVSVDEVFRQANLHKLINSTETIVYEAKVVPTNDYCTPFSCPMVRAPLKPNVYLYGLRHEDEEDSFYALVNNNNSFSLLDYQKNKTNFLKEVGLPADSSLHISWFFPTKLKDTDETFTNFVDNVADIIAKQFGELLFRTGYEKTSFEKTVDFLLIFVPFYYCITNSIAGKAVEATLACFGDAITWIPFVGQLINIGVKLSTVALKQFFLSVGISLKTFTTRQVFMLAFKAGIREAAVGLSQTFTNVLFTRNMLKSLSLSVIRAVDPGFELSWKILLSGKALLGKVMKHLFNSLKRLSTKIISSKYKSIFKLKNKIRESVKSQTLTRLSIGDRDGHKIFMYTYPGGKYPCGPEYIALSSGIAELRRVIGFKIEVPVRISRISKNGKVYYKKLDLKTEKLYGLELELNKNKVLMPVRQPPRVQLATVMREGLNGKGALTRKPIIDEITKKEETISNAARRIESSNLGFNKVQAEKIMRHYCLRNSIATDFRSVQLQKILGQKGNLPSHSTNNLKASEDVSINRGKVNIDKYVGQDNVLIPVEDLLLLEDFLPSKIDKNLLDQERILPSGSTNHANSPVNEINSDNYYAQSSDSYASEISINNRFAYKTISESQTKHLSVAVPTYEKFVEDWIKTGLIAEQYKKWFLSSPDELKSLLCNQVLDNLKLKDIIVARKRIAVIYGESYPSNDVMNLLDHFVRKKMNRYVNFEDYTAFSLWKNKGFPNINENKDIKKAFFRLTARQAGITYADYPTTYYYSVRKHFKEVDQEIENSLQTKDFFEVTSDEQAAVQGNYWVRHPAPSSSLNVKDTRLIVFNLFLERKYMVTKLKPVLPSLNADATLISPGIQFHLLSVEEKIINGENVVIVKLNSEHCLKENWLVYVMNEIEKLK